MNCPEYFSSGHDNINCKQNNCKNFTRCSRCKDTVSCLEKISLFCCDPKCSWKTAIVCITKKVLKVLQKSNCITTVFDTSLEKEYDNSVERRVQRTRLFKKDLPEITSIPGDEIDNIKIEHGNGTKYANQKMGESIKDNCANEFCRFTTLVHNTFKTFSKMTKPTFLPPTRPGSFEGACLNLF